VHINRCGVLAGAGQFGKADQGIFSYWIHSYRSRRPLKYIGLGGSGQQVRDCLHPRDLGALVAMQIRHPEKGGKVLNVSGGLANSISLAQLSKWCALRFGPHQISSEPEDRPYDVPWLVLDCAKAQTEWNWRPATPLEQILGEIAEHAERHPGWLDLSGGA
jgi:CDP-paratose 2-epimerase